MTAGLCPTDGPRMVPGRSASGPCGSDVYQRWGVGSAMGVGSVLGGGVSDGRCRQRWRVGQSTQVDFAAGTGFGVWWGLSRLERLK